jgi:peptide deformylase
MKILIDGDRRLREKATRVRRVDDSLRQIAADMWETMEAAEGVGLAGPQVGVMRRIITVSVPAGMDDDDDPEYGYILMNPEIVRGYGDVTALEGCLSIPGWAGDVTRRESVTVKASGMDDKPIRIKAHGYLARVLQHEIDHLDGILYPDRMAEEAELVRVEDEDLSEEATMLSHS